MTKTMQVLEQTKCLVTLLRFCHVTRDWLREKSRREQRGLKYNSIQTYFYCYQELPGKKIYTFEAEQIVSLTTNIYLFAKMFIYW